MVSSLHLLPSGIFHPGVVNIIGPGVRWILRALYRAGRHCGPERADAHLR